MLESVIPLLQKNDWFIIIDLKDAYFHISIKKNHRKYICFALKGVLYQFKSLPFSLSTAPHIFTKCLVPSLLTFIYTASLVSSSSLKGRGSSLQDTRFSHSLLADLVLQVNFKKSMLMPSQVTVYIL